MRRTALLSAAVAVAGALVIPAMASSPSSGQVTPDAGTTWTGPTQTVASTNGPAADDCSATGAFCDDYTLTVPVDPSYWDTHGGGIRINVDWTLAQNDFDVYVYDADGKQATFAAGGPPSTEESALLLAPSGTYTVRVVYFQVVNDGYTATANWEDKPVAPPPGQPIFDTTQSLDFAPSTTVSPSLFGTEPQQTIERRIPESLPNAIDPNRIFVDWPNDGLQSSSLSRSNDGGDSFRILSDPLCSGRERPNCATMGGGDSEEDVNLRDGTLLFADQSAAYITAPQPYTAQEAVASSTDHGDSFPIARQHAFDNVSALSEDRQWLTSTNGDPVEVGGSKIVGFLSYHNPDQFIHGIDENGALLTQSTGQLTNVYQSGPIRFDSSGGPGNGWIYQPYYNGDGVEVATVQAQNYQTPAGQPGGWTVHNVTPSQPSLFPWLNLDNHGNAYIGWVTKGVMYLSASPIDDPRNDPAQGGTPGSYWTPQFRVSLPDVGSAVFAAVTAGDSGRVGIAYLGAPGSDYVGTSGDAPNTVPWQVYSAVVTNALSADPATPPVVTTGLVSHRIVHYGPICTGGISCNSDNRSLLDMIDIGYDEAGRLGVVYTDNNSTMQMPDGIDADTRYAPFVQYAKQTAGPSVVAARSPIAVSAPVGSVRDAANDATWPNTAAGTNLPAFDVRSASLATSTDGADLIAKITLADASTTGMLRDLATYDASPSTDARANRIQYVLRFADGSNVYHLSAAYDLHTNSLRFFGGRLDDNDGESYLVPQLYLPRGTDYVDDDLAGVHGQVWGSTLVIEVPLASLGITDPASIVGATGFALAGHTTDTGYTIVDPSNPNTAPSLSSTTTPPRVVDASPPFDLVAH